MGASPQFAATPRAAAGSVSATNTNRDGTGTIVTLLTAGTNGTKIEEVVVKSDGDPADSTIVFYLHDGSNYFVYDEWDIGNPAAGSATVASYREARVFDNLVLPNNNWSLRASITAAPTAGTVKVHVFGGDF
jgi:hypothetical protein